MESEEDTGIFLFKNSKTKTSTESIFIETETTTTKAQESVGFANGKWMKKFLKKFLTPALLHTPVTAVTSEQIALEAERLPPFRDAKGEDVLVISGKEKVRKVTRGNRRHKIKTRRQRNLKKNQK